MVSSIFCPLLSLQVLRLYGGGGKAMNIEKRMIDANALMAYTRNQKSRTVDCNDIARFPTVDAVEVVRCEDCKHWQPIHEHIPHWECQIFCGAYEHGYPTNADDFCSYGERKDND